MHAEATVPLRTGTFAAFQSADFRLYFVGQLISYSGTWMQNLAQGYLVFQLTQSEAWLGLVACAAGLPVILMAPVTGVIIERVPRRRLLQTTQVTQMVLALLLAVLTFTGTIQVAHILVLAFLLGTTNALDLPARQTFVVEVVGPRFLQSGIALIAVLNSASRTLGPMAAGLALVQFGPAWCFLLNGLSFIAAIIFLALLRAPFAIETVRVARPIEQIRQGLSFARHHSTIAPLLLLTTIGGIAVVPIVQILPAFADVVLHSPEQGYAALTVALGIGSVIAGIIASQLARRFGYGRVLVTAAFGSAVGTCLLALQVTIPASVAVNLFAGLMLVLLFVSLNTSIQTVVPNEYRGRVLALYTLAFMGISPFSALLLGLVANSIGTPAAMMLFGLTGAILSGWVVARWPHILNRV